MNITDPIADLLTRVRNGQSAGHDIVTVPASRVKIAITHILRREGFIRNYKCVRDKKQGLIKIALKYNEQGEGVIRDISRRSRPGRRVYLKSTDVKSIKGGYGIGIVSTSRGLLTDKEAKEQRLGGEYICSVF